MQFPTLNGSWQHVSNAGELLANWCGRRAQFPVRTSEDRVAERFLSEPDSDPTALLVDRMLEKGRQALLLRPELSSRMSPAQLRAARQHLAATTASISATQVTLTPWRLSEQSGSLAAPAGARPVAVDAFRLDRFQVSNQEYQRFVQDDGYGNESFWTTSVRKRLGDFLDRSGSPGPRFWTGGKFPEGQANHPVVGICWYEAMAFARWQGKRLPTDAEWICAACSPLVTEEGRISQRQYPWGHEPRANAANLWGVEFSGTKAAKPRGYQPNGTLEVDALPDGATPAGVRQMLGNVWEWTAGEFCVAGADEVAGNPLKSLRGGAFDTYFGDQAHGQLQSGDSPWARKRNIGFRCAVSGLELDGDADDQSPNHLIGVQGSPVQGGDSQLRPGGGLA